MPGLQGPWAVECGDRSYQLSLHSDVCERCLGAGWIETGSDPIEVTDIEMTPDGHPQWTIRRM
jgi:hypothetical protein